MEKDTVIALSKTKLLLLIAGACGFVALGCWMVSMDADKIVPIASTPGVFFKKAIPVIGIVSIVFFGACALFALKKFADKKPGMILSPSGMLDNSNGVSADFIPWSEITGFSVWEFQRQKILVVNVVDPQKWINMGGPIWRKLKYINFKLAGSPITISSNLLKVNFAELLFLCNAYLAKYGKHRASHSTRPY
ncbi:MAG: hypothetical protein FWC42_09835 [Proteobacteria bacterium]|nr:hypothetical protein [Pseudomonadota bacterium]